MHYVKNKLRILIKNNLVLRCLIRLFKNRKDISFLEKVLSTEYPPEILIFGNDKLKMEEEKCYLLFDLRGDDVGTRGFCALLRYALACCSVAEKIDAVPFINIEDSLYNVPGGFLGCENMYSYYFETPKEGKINIINNRNCIMFRMRNIDLVYNSFSDEKTGTIVNGYKFTEPYLREMGRIMYKYVHLKNELKEEFEIQIQTLLKKRKTLGIHIRGTDFTAGLEKHPIAVTADSYYEYIDAALQQGFEMIFVATDDESILRELINKYPQKVIFYQDTYRSKNGIALHMQKIERVDNEYYLGKELLRDVYTLAACDGLVAGLSQVSFCTRIVKYAQNAEFSYLIEIDHGINKKRDNEKLEDYKKKLSKEGIKLNFD